MLDIVWSSGDPDQAVTELMQRGAQILIPCGSSASVAAQRRAPTIPIVFINVGNPIAMGLVESLSRPVRNATGFSDIQSDLSGKLVDVARELRKLESPSDTFGIQDGRTGRTDIERPSKQPNWPVFGREEILDAAEINDAIAVMKSGGATTLIVQTSPFMFLHRDRIIGSAMSYGLATIFGMLVAAHEGGLIAYGPDQIPMYRAAPFYVDRILKGTKPADLPVEQPTKVGLLVNLKTAKALGIDVPLALLFAPTS